MPSTPLAEQASGFIIESFKDGELSDGSPTEQEVAAAAANAPRKEAAAGSADKGGEGQEDQADQGAAGAEGGEGAADEGAPEGKDGADEKPGADENKQPKGGKKSVADRIGDLTSNWRTEQRRADSEKTRADRLEAELAAVKGGKAPLTPQADTAKDDTGPDPSQFDYGELDPKYIAALARHETAQALKAHRAEDDKARQSQAADDQRQKQATKQGELVKAGVKLHDDFDEVVMQGAREGKWDLSQHLGELLLDSEFGAQIAYDLAKDPDEAARVAKLSAVEQAKYLGRQEAKFEAAKPSQAGKTPPKVPQAPTPPKTPRGNSGSNKVGSESADFAAVEAAWRGGQFK